VSSTKGGGGPRPSDRPDLLLADGGLPATTADDVAALRRHRPRAGASWVDELTLLAAQAPGAAAELRRRRTSAGLRPFEL
jgi:hypothetical protein